MSPNIEPFLTKGKWRGRPRTFHKNQFIVVTKKGGPGGRGTLRVHRTGPLDGRDLTEEDFLANITGVIPSDIAFVEPDFAVKSVLDLEGVPNDPLIVGDTANRIQWSIKRIGMAAAWARQQGNDAVRVVIVDTGLHDHDDLDISRFLYGEDFTTLPADETVFTPSGVFVSDFVLSDINGHGTEMAGIIAATADNEMGVAGLNWNSPVGFCVGLGEGGRGLASGILASVLQAIKWAQNAGDKKLVINLSMVEVDDPLDARFRGPAASLTFDYMCQQAGEAGAILVCGAGNSEVGIGSPALYSDKYENTVLAVGATWLNGGVRFTQKMFEDGGLAEGVVGPYASGPQMSVVAPGYDFPTLYSRGQYEDNFGTSIAAAHVTGLVSLMWSHAPELTSGEIIQRIKDTAWMPGSVEVDGNGHNNDWGYGRIVASDALISVEKVPVLGLVLDHSGSMGRPAGDDAGSTRLDVLRRAVETLVRILEPHSVVGVVGFNHTALGDGPITEIDPDTPNVSQTNIIDQVGLLQAEGWTSIGAGVEEGARLLRGIADSAVTGIPYRAIVLITDGKENRAPRINPYGADRVVDLPGLGVPVHSIGAGTEEVVDVAALDTLAAGTLGSRMITGGWGDGSEQLLTKYFFQHVIVATGDAQLVDPTGFIKPDDDSITIPFAVSSDDRRFDVVLLAPTKGVIELSLFAPDGDAIKVTTLAQGRHAQIEQHDRSVLYRVSLPYPLGDGATAGPGEWKAVLSLNQDRYDDWLQSLSVDGRDESVRKYGVRYTLMVGARSRLTMEARASQSVTEDGDTMTIDARFIHDGQPLDVNGATVSVEVTRPDGSPDQLSLQPDGDGFNGVLVLPENGVHACRVVARGTIDGQPFQREHTLTGVVWDPSKNIDEEGQSDTG